MIIKSLNLVNFRNYEKLNVSFHPSINVIYGLNGQGKTNLVEAIIYLSNLKSFRNTGENELIKLDSDSFVVEGVVLTNELKKKLKVSYFEGKKHLFLGINEIKKMGEFIGNLNAIAFCPSDVSFFDDIPERRRKFIDQELAKLSPAYLFTLNQYKTLLKNKNLILKGEIENVYFDVINGKLASLADYLIDKRIEFLKNIEIYCQKIFKDLYQDSNINLKIEYRTYRKGASSLDYFLKKKDEEINKRKSLVGVHLDDLRIYLNNNDIVSFGSQGQKRLAILSVKLGLLEYIKSSRNENVVVVLDDVLSELDINKRTNLLNYLNKNNQVFITTSNRNDIEDIELENVFYYKIENGTLRED